jgi:hypothetical protein
MLMYDELGGGAICTEHGKVLPLIYRIEILGEQEFDGSLAQATVRRGENGGKIAIAPAKRRKKRQKYKEALRPST